ncbi:hypothetical protein [Vibrio casei]|uniref:hypothetical protein n=1 Tax=Vibrio casei TaxID=673372 RepID=UPI000DA6C2F8|nr:hypothetical protein [Vibrio casei]
MPFLRGIKPLHVKFHPEFILRLNVEMGRLKGWVKSKQEAAQELDVDLESIAHLYNCNVQLGANNIRLLQAA